MINNLSIFAFKEGAIQLSEIAFYGKGGIGKSTISANVSAALANLGQKVLQIGCDPKHDSTRLLLGGRNITTVLSYLKTRSPDQCRLEDVVFSGYGGVHCVEAGGPEPGVGCAGRGILTTFELLDRLGIKSNQYDTIVYDVLGDVVCGGFAVPLRREYANKVYIVTSGEFMAIYAANNILRGLKNYDRTVHRAGGLIFNSRGLAEEDERIKRFAEAVQLPVLEKIPRSDLFAESEKAGQCLVEKYPDSEIAAQFARLTQFILNQNVLQEARPLTDEHLEEIVLEKRPLVTVSEEIKIKVEHQKSEKQFFSKNLIAREPLYGCAFNGALGVTTQITDGISLAHGPASCAHLAYQTVTSAGRKGLLERGSVIPEQIAPRIVSSDMNEGIMIFGGLEELKQKIAQVKVYKPKYIYVVTACASGIIGDDLSGLEELNDSETRIIPILADGNINGDFLQGILLAYMETGRALIDPHVKPEADTVNLIGEKTEGDTTEVNFKAFKELIERLGLKVNCRFICRTTGEEIRRLLAGRLNILAWDDYMGRTIRDFLESEYKAEFLEQPLPVGFSETKKWLEALAAFFGREEMLDDILLDYTEQYWQRIAELKPFLQGKKLAIVTCNYQLDWIIQTALDLEMEVVKVCLLYSSQDNCFKTSFREQIGELVLDCSAGERIRHFPKEADLILQDQISEESAGNCFTDTVPFGPPIGFFSGLKLAERWKEIFQMNLKEGWRNDEKLYRKYLG